MDRNAWSFAGKSKSQHNFFKRSTHSNASLSLYSSYIISDFFSITFEPSVFRLKGHHSKLCEIKVSVFDRLIFFRRIPIVLEVHRILDPATLIAKAELAEIESIDDPKWKEDSYVEHAFLHLNIRVHMQNNEDRQDDNIYDIDGTCAPCGGVGIDPGAGGDGSPVVLTEEQQKQTEREELIKRLSMKRKLNANEIIELSMAIDHRITIFEKLFWKNLSKSNFMRINPERTRNKFNQTYDQVIVVDNAPSPLTNMSTNVDHKWVVLKSQLVPKLKTSLFFFAYASTILSIISRLMVEAINDLAKNWRFIPPEYYDHDP